MMTPPIVEAQGQPPTSSKVTAMAAKSPFVCNVCKKTYTRLDHLGRHYRTHTSERPFVCETCGKGFARCDLLRRHRTNHVGNAKSLKSSGKDKAARATRACDSCAEAKLRCSNSQPCDRCVAKGISCQMRRPASCMAPRETADAMAYLAVVEPEDQPQQNQQNQPQPRPDLPGATQYQPQSLQEQQFPFHFSSDPDAVALGQNTALGNGDVGARSSSVNIDQLLTPLSAPYSSNNMMYIGNPEADMNVSQGFNDIVMGNFLRTVVNADMNTSDFDASDLGTFPDVLNFGLDEMFDIPSSFFDRSGLQALTKIPSSGFDQNQPRGSRSGTETPAIHKAIHIGEQAFKESMWLWTPSFGDNQASEQVYLTLPENGVMTETQLEEIDSALRLSLTSRDRLLSMILRTCEPRVQRHVVSCFPSTDFLSFLLTSFKTRHSQQVAPWIHFPTLEINKDCEEFLAALICWSAGDSKVPEVRKLGFAMQEAVRLGVAKRFEEDNRNTRDLRCLQAYLMVLHVGLWSGTRRKIEIAESFTLPLVTMLRRSAHFRSQSQTIPKWDNDAQSVEVRWRRWAEAESFKRLVFHILYQDACSSIALLRQPVVSYSEINLPMPCSNDLWLATTAEAWQQLSLAHRGESHFAQPTLRDCIQDPGLLGAKQAYIDVQSSLIAMVATFWLRVWPCLQMKAAFSPEGSRPNLVTVNSYHQELVASAQDLILRASELHNALDPSTKLMLELCLLHLHVSLEDIQLLAGKEGEEQARKTVSHLRTWIELPESRHALFHAGQILNAATQCPSAYLGGFHAVGVYHASLTMWAYAVLSTSRTNYQGQINNDAMQSDTRFVRLDGEETPELRRFILLGKGNPCIRSHLNNDDNMGHAGLIALSDASGVMLSTVALLTQRNGHEHSSPLISNLTKLMQSLANASTAMKRPRHKSVGLS